LLLVALSLGDVQTDRSLHFIIDRHANEGRPTVSARSSRRQLHAIAMALIAWWLRSGHRVNTCARLAYMFSQAGVCVRQPPSNAPLRVGRIRNRAPLDPVLMPRKLAV
jgi:hypothetical protein